MFVITLFLFSAHQLMMLYSCTRFPKSHFNKSSGPSCSKLRMSLVNDSLKFTSSDTQICSAKATHIFSAKNIRILYIEFVKIVNEMTFNELVKLTTL